MTNQVLEEALLRKAKLERQIDELSLQLAEIEDFIELFEKHFAPKSQPIGIGTPQILPQTASIQLPEVRIRTRRLAASKKNPSRKQISQLARKLMLERGSPLTRTQLVEGLATVGFPIVAADASKAIGTTMWRLRNEFTNIEGHGYWPINEPCPSVGYDPSANGKNEL